MIFKSLIQTNKGKNSNSDVQFWRHLQEKWAPILDYDGLDPITGRTSQISNRNPARKPRKRIT